MIPGNPNDNQILVSDADQPCLVEVGPRCDPYGSNVFEFHSIDHCSFYFKTCPKRNSMRNASFSKDRSIKPRRLASMGAR